MYVNEKYIKHSTSNTNRILIADLHYYKQSKDVLAHSMRAYRGTSDILYSDLTSTLDGVEW